MIIKNLALLLLLTVFTTSGASAHSSDNWYSGVIVLRSGETLPGDVYYDYHTDVVQWRSALTTRAFAPAQVKFFRLEESKSEQEHHFVPMVFNPRPGYRYESFFEVVSKGPINVYRKHNLRKHLTVNPRFMRVNPALGFSNEVIGFDYYFLNNEGLRKIKSFRKEFFPMIMQERKADIERFVQDNHLKMFQQASQIIVVQYYNYLKDPLKNKWDAENSVALH
jgi:hypothetical protein